MYNTKALLALAILADVSVAQTFPDPGCSSSVNELLLAAPTIPAAVASAFGAAQAQATDIPSPDSLLSDPNAYVGQICEVVPLLPSPVLSEFATWGASLLHFASVEISSYDAIVTKCITTGTAAASITSYIHSIASSPEGLCQPTSTSAPSGGNGTASITPYPTATPSGNSTSPSTAVPTTLVPTAAAARPTGALISVAAVGGLLGAIALL
ncbi:hypothetical protein F4859DRAFT_491710 [Xylaria cf. heliscus]|nr:hypothetical protein F4859DRAFT_491710 [Xylaria cf. heliscus]